MENTNETSSGTGTGASYSSNKLSALKIKDPMPLLATKERSKCPKCSRPRKYYCYDCLVKVGDAALFPEDLALPIQCDVLHWHTETKGKSTAMHCAILAPSGTRVIECTGQDEEIPDYDEASTVLLFPAEDAYGVEDFPHIENIKRVVFVDSQWHSTNRILRLPRVKKLKTIKIKSQQTMFWRYQEQGRDFLATIEAIYYFYEEFVRRTRGAYNGEYDNLLFLFSLHYNLIHNRYVSAGLEFPRMPDYIPETVGGTQLRERVQDERKPKRQKKE